ADHSGCHEQSQPSFLFHQSNPPSSYYPELERGFMAALSSEAERILASEVLASEVLASEV
ncbi:MAG: hypothetical protein ACLSX2_02700, partial [Christensenellaceae bacterium]